MKTKTVLQRPAAYLVYGIAATIPLIFGAVHPLVLGCYVFVIFAGLGGWLLLNPRHMDSPSPSFFVAVPILLFIYILLQSIPLPLDWLDWLSPSRASRIRLVNELAGTEITRIAISENGSIGLFRCFFYIAVMLYYFSVKRLLASRSNFQKTFVAVLVAVGAIEAVYGLIQFINPHIGILWLSNPGRAAHGTIIYKNQYAGMLNMIWPLALASGICTYAGNRQKNHRQGIRHKIKEQAEALSTTKLQVPLMLFAAGAMILAILFSLSRGGILAMVLVAMLLVITMPFSRAGKIGTIVVSVGLIAAYGALLGLDTIISRFGSLDDSGANRLDIYLSSLPMLIDHWLTGIGIGSYVLLSPIYLKGFPATILYDSVHNEYLELVIELGVPAAAVFFVWLLAGMLKISTVVLAEHRRQGLDRGRLAIGTAAYCGLIGLLVHGLIDFGWRLPVNVVYCATLLAICSSSLQPQKQKEAVLENDGSAARL